MPPKRIPADRRYSKVFRQIPGAVAIFLTALGTLPALAAEVESHPGISLEPMYSEAVIAYNAKQPVEALRVLDALLKIKPDYVQALELKALVLKSSGKPSESKATYEALIQSSPKDKTAPYHFELGVILFNDKQPAKAAPHFDEAIAQSFNADASHFFLGLIDFNMADKPGKLHEAEKHFSAVADGGAAELKPAAHYYLGLISYKNGDGSNGTHELIEARGIARSMKGNPLADNIEKAVGTALAPYGQAQWFGNVSVLEAYNDNISSLPNNSPSGASPTSGISSLQTLLVAGLGRVSSPLETLQWVASYRGTFNLNYNTPAASPYQFLTHAADLYLTLNPLARTQYGFKLEGNYNFNFNSPGASTFSAYSLTGEVGPYMRRELSRGLLLNLEAFFRPQYFFNQNGDYDQGGTNSILRATLTNDTGGTWWNPSYSLGLEKNRTNGSIYRDWGPDLTFSNLFRIGATNLVTATLAFSYYAYTEADLIRFDKLIVTRLDWIHNLNQHWTTVVDVAYQANYSTLPSSYQYTQRVMSAGFGYNM